MCDCNLLVDRHFAPVEVSPKPHTFFYEGDHGRKELLSGFYLLGDINYASVSAITHSHGVRRGYMFIVGEAEPSDPTNVP